MKLCTLGGISVELGERRREVESLADAVELFKAHKLPMNARLLGYRDFHQNTLAPESMVGAAIQRALAQTGIDPSGIDMMILASADAGFMHDRQWLIRLLEMHRLSSALPLVMTGQECTSLLAAIDIAARHVREGERSRVLVVSYDEVKEDAQRVHSFGVVSDAASACVVSGREELDFSIKGYVHRADLRGMLGGDDFDSRKSLLNAVIDALLQHAGIPMDAIRCVFTTNFFKPLTAFNASSMGIGVDRVHADPRQGHCLCADPLLNAAQYLRRDRDGRRGDTCLLQAHAPGFLAAMLVERCADALASEVGERADLVEESW
ncbi:MAG: hypothetical protein ACTHNE_07595 [Dyella sp.]|uniref:hypothetical protein n=1 Tax=Dyella sp. TaxID=1869338 RepID=UPI003F8153F7